MSGQNVIVAIEAQNARFEAKFEAQNAKLDAISAAQDSQWRMLMWMIGAAVVVLSILIRFGN